ADALGDESPLVREAAARTAGAIRAERALDALRGALRADPSWSVRRAAVRALASALGERAAPDLFAALDDPFWRVRFAAIQALAAWPHLASPGGPGTPQRAAALAYLAALRRGEPAPDDPPHEP